MMLGWLPWQCGGCPGEWGAGHGDGAIGAVVGWLHRDAGVVAMVMGQLPGDGAVAMEMMGLFPW